ncbi:MAG: outer membrane protein assembly factor BamD [Deferribacteraceae bacterium]|jgi:outer membrane protein assembly factor BamD|nr:outer membrane protein assembly factor BamD [Deferribacteraceae bacterium]
MKQFCLIFIAAFTLCVACSKYVEVDKSSQELIGEGVALMEAKKYNKAAQKFENAILNAEIPADAQDAQRRLADAYFMDKNFLDAVAAYEVYYDIYYQSPYAPYILNRLGLSYSNMSMNPKRDQTYAVKSTEYFDQLEALHPEEFKNYGAESERQNMYMKLSEHEYQVGRYYMRTSKPESAIMRFRYLLDNYPTSHRVEDSYISMIKSALKLDDGAVSASQYLKELVDSYPDNGDIKSLTKKVNKKQKIYHEE